ncbi:7-cyano-7-deazaguanine synthase [Propionicicella superfundia]|uniref:7-cyano-7-deazaguanine synthase n=1 Tax=Propionicicella superfundia TaxID=348582 RepID=UPI00146AB65C|nr:7-cyano-7-deazaguanine synthase [Propionicicella superfundia]
MLRWASDLTVDGRGFRQHLAEAIPAEASDLLILAASAYAVDRMVPRPGLRQTRDSGDWHRDLALDVPVSDPDRWAVLAPQLERLLRWLTDDNWHLGFSRRTTGQGPLDPSQQALFSTVPTGCRPILFSGGLDSGCALQNALAVGDAVAISVHTNSWMQNTQQTVAKGLASLSSNHLAALSFRVNLPAGGAETSQRTRGMLFLASGTMAAIAAGANGLVVAENGVGAINLPYLASQRGTEATRAMHPKTLHMFSDIVTTLTGSDFTVEAPYLMNTKAELISLTSPTADDVLSHTVSCDSGFSARVVDRAPCGCCTSCILRRQSLAAAGRPVIDGRLPYRRQTPSGVPEFAAMAWQALRLRRCLCRADPWTQLLLEFPELVHLEGLLGTDQVLQLYGRYVQEFETYLKSLGVEQQWM